jgi:Amt family ammonium transporter
MAGHIIMDKIGLDDALEAVQVHAFGGIWGIIAVAFFSKDVGILYSHPDSGRLLGIQLVGLTCMVSWSGIMSGIFFFVTNKFGVLRLSPTEEIIGSDLTYFGPL